jgi:hypothetical protein
VPSDFCDQLRETRAILAWLVGGTDEIPVDDDNRGRLIGARGDYARTDEDIRQALDRAAEPEGLRPPRAHVTVRLQALLALGRHLDVRRLAARRP